MWAYPSYSISFVLQNLYKIQEVKRLLSTDLFANIQALKILITIKLILDNQSGNFNNSGFYNLAHVNIFKILSRNKTLSKYCQIIREKVVFRPNTDCKC